MGVTLPSPRSADTPLAPLPPVSVPTVADQVWRMSVSYTHLDVYTRQFISFLARAAHQDVLDGVVQYRAQMQHSRDVGGRDDDRVGRLFRSRVSLETTLSLIHI